MTQHLLFTTREAAEFLALSPRTLDDFRQRGCGPRFLKFGAARRSAVRYRLADLEAFLKMSERQSTSDAGSDTAV